jgi:peptidylprolyl isomerase domain and WD repeat-containing protein 1
MSDKESLKRGSEAVDEDSDDDFGPMPAAAAPVEAENEIENEKIVAKKPRKTLPFEKTYVESLPSGATYERSFMHRDIVTHVAVAKSSEFVITGSSDGHVKFWKKMPDNIEFVKHFQAHLGPIHSLLVSPDDLKLVTTSLDKMIKFFEIQSFDMSHMISTGIYINIYTYIYEDISMYFNVCIYVYRHISTFVLYIYIYIYTCIYDIHDCKIEFFEIQSFDLSHMISTGICT